MRRLLIERLRPFALHAVGASFVLHLALLVPVLCVLKLFESVLAAGDGAGLLTLGGIALSGMLLAYVADRIRNRALLAAGRAFDRELLPAAIANSLDALRDVGVLRAFLGNPGMLALLDLPWLMFYIAAITVMDPLLGLAALTGVALLACILAVAAGIARSARSDALLRAARTANDHAEDLVRSADTLVTMGMSQDAIASWRERHDGFFGRRQRAERSALKLAALVRAGSLALLVGVLSFGAWLVIESLLSVGAMIAATVLLGLGVRPLEPLIGHWSELRATRGAWLRLARRSMSIVLPGIATPLAAGRIHLDRVSYAPYSGGPLWISNVSLSLAPGESILIAGPSGSGKTTLARLMLGILRPQTGSVRLDGMDIERGDRKALGRRVGYLPQQAHLFPGTIAENIARFGALDSTRIVQAAQLAQAHRTIVRLTDGYHAQVSDTGTSLSAGQRSSIALARAVYAGPQLLVLDEPAMDGDTEADQALFDTLAELKALGTTVIIFGQRATLADHVDRLAILRDGVLQPIDREQSQPYAIASVVHLHRAAPQTM